MIKWIVASAILLLNAALAVAGDGAPKVQACTACHGAQGVSANPQWPNLAGQNAAYLVAQITAFRDGTRENLAMAPFVASLSDADIQAIADHYASLEVTVTANGDAAQVATGENLSSYCKACHGMQGIPAADAWPIIAGQHAPYLQNQLAAFKSGARVNSHMAAAIARFGEPEFAALAAYYSQLEPR